MIIPPRHKPRAFQALLSLDMTGRERQELAEAGVAQHRIDAIYPVTFTDLVPGLKQHLLDLGGEHMYLRGDLLALNTLFDKAKQSLWSDQLHRHQRDLEADVPLLGELRDHLLETWSAAHTEQRPKLSVMHPMCLSSAWWCMSNFEELTEGAQTSSSALLVGLDEAWQLPRRGKRV